MFLFTTSCRMNKEHILHVFCTTSYKEFEASNNHCMNVCTKLKVSLNRAYSSKGVSLKSELGESSSTLICYITCTESSFPSRTLLCCRCGCISKCCWLTRIFSRTNGRRWGWGWGSLSSGCMTILASNPAK